MLNEIDRNIRLTAQLFHNKLDAIDEFHISIEHFVKSFLIAIPLILMQLYSKPLNFELFAQLDPSLAAMPQNSDFFDSLKLIAGWLVWPVIAYILLSLMDLKTHYFRYVIIDNWGTLLTNGLLTLPFILFQYGVAAPIISMLIIFLTLVKLTFKWRIAKSALETTGLNASIILFVDMATSMLFINLLANIVA